MIVRRAFGRPRGWVLFAAVSLMALAGPLAAVLGSEPAGAAGTFTIVVTPQSATALTFLVSNADATCSNSQLQVTAVAGPGNTPVTPTSVVHQDANDVVVTLPSGTPTPVTFSGSCLDVEIPISATADPVAFATVNVQKVVVGSDPPGDTFTVQVSCLGGGGAAGASGASGFGSGSSSVHSSDGAPPSLQYGAAGGTSPVYVFGPSTCTLSETNAGGAASTTISPNPVDVVDPAVFSATVTNVFPAAPLVVAPAFTG